MLVVLVNKGRRGCAVYVVQSAASQRKAVRGEILNRWSEINSAIEPRLYSVLIGRGDVYQMSCQKRTDVAGDDVVSVYIPLNPTGVYKLQGRQQNKRTRRRNKQPHA